MANQHDPESLSRRENLGGRWVNLYVIAESRFAKTEARREDRGKNSQEGNDDYEVSFIRDLSDNDENSAAAAAAIGIVLIGHKTPLDLPSPFRRGGMAAEQWLARHERSTTSKRLRE